MSGKNIFSIAKKLCHLGTLFLVAAWGANAQQAAQGLPGAVYVMTNQTSGNSIAVFNRAPNGALKMVGTFPTGGTGFGTGGDPLGSEGSLILSSDGHFLFAANAGSNDISVMQVSPTRVSLIDKVPSGGTEPVSIA
ncbi:MAG: beta-propeller fold lactonase family protein, partial [Terriglobia bacterium]